MDNPIEDNMIRNATITNVVDGDTFDADVALGYGITVNQRFRINGINAPEVFGAEKETGKVSEKFMNDNFLKKDILIHNKGLDSFRRNLAEIYFVNADNVLVNVAEMLVGKGLAEYKEIK